MDNEPTLKIDRFGTKRWRLPNGNLHRVDGPAIEFTNGIKTWRLNGGRHRVDGPAIEWANGDKAWYLEGRGYTFDKWLEANKYISDEEKVMLKLIHG
jgi:hypothetical protein